MLHKSLALARPILVAFSLCAARCDAQYIDLISPGPPATPSDYLKMTFSFGDNPAAVEMRLVTIVSPIIPIVNNAAYLRRQATWFNPSNRGDISTRVYAAPFDPTGLFIINFAPEVDANLLAVDVAVSASHPLNNSVNQRDVTITGLSGYQRSFTVQNIPEPTSALVALCGAAFVGRRLRRRRRA